MVSSRPYLIRAIYEWIVDSGLTPYMLVDAGMENVSVPTQYIQDGKIILNIGPQAVHGLELTNEWIMFSARFSGASLDVSLPPQAVLAVYAKENGRGMVFNEEDGFETDDPDTDPTPPTPDGGGKPKLRVVK